MKALWKELKKRGYKFSWEGFGFEISAPKEDTVKLTDLLEEERKWANENPGGHKFSGLGPFSALPVHLLIFGLLETIRDLCWISCENATLRQDYSIEHLALILEWLKDLHPDLNPTEYDVLCDHMLSVWDSILETEPQEGRKIAAEYKSRIVSL